MTHSVTRTRIKYCGITQLSDALEAVRLGVDALGFVFYPPSPRNIEIEKAADIIRQLPAFISCVGLFVDSSEEFIRQVLQSTAIDILQFHGNETVTQCQRYSKPYLKAVRMKPDVDLAAVAREYSTAAALLLDTYEKGLPGGTGTSFDWGRVPESLAKPVILAGGLSADNVAKAIQTVKPYAVDVSGGIEQSKGIKDAAKMAAFVNAVNLA
ncbi:Phosphoribosylanthranilate isomerase [hydrothermal vent metagenome]|uniref:phosphoribosylanthranilate isomerase n=1 Tax=hydrothermal vent metagenome TaxID=652676 RepID=A0A3B1AGR4_9ZZZZ